MTFNKLRMAIPIVEKQPVRLSPQSLTYLRTYPALVEAASILRDKPDLLLNVLSTLAYGWMPRIVRLDTDCFDDASKAIKVALAITSPLEQPSIIVRIAACLRSVVGASKLLHFLRPAIFPIWDSKVASEWRSTDPSQPFVPSQSFMSDPRYYLEYAADVGKLCDMAEAPAFFIAFGAAYSDRLASLRIEKYVLTPVRAIEAAAFELGGGNYDDD